jgi:hypothetical protein
VAFKNAYIILAHKDPQQVLRLVNALDDPEAIFVFHICKNASRETYQEFRTLFNKPNHHFCKRVRSFWGGIGLVQATLNALYCLDNINSPYSFVHLLSGQDYPIKSREQRDAFLKQHPQAEFVRNWKFYPLTEEDKEHHPYRDEKIFQHARLLYHHVRLGKELYIIPTKYDLSLKNMPFLKAVAFYLRNFISYIRQGQFKYKTIEWFLTRMLEFPRKLPSLQFYAGSHWFSLTPVAVKYLLEFDKNDRFLKKFYKRVLLPDESYFQTVLLNSPIASRVVNDNLRYVIFPLRAKNPVFITENEFDGLTNTTALFARKFDTIQSATVMDKIDKQLIGLG